MFNGFFYLSFPFLVLNHCMIFSDIVIQDFLIFIGNCLFVYLNIFLSLTCFIFSILNLFKIIKISSLIDYVIFITFHLINFIGQET